MLYKNRKETQIITKRSLALEAKVIKLKVQDSIGKRSYYNHICIFYTFLVFLQLDIEYRYLVGYKVDYRESNLFLLFCK